MTKRDRGNFKEERTIHKRDSGGYTLDSHKERVLTSKNVIN
jgi:hypothetical protein